MESSLTHIKTATKDYYIDNMNRRQGEFKDYRDNGQLHVHGFYVNGKYHGDYKLYYKSGKLLRHCYYKDDRRHGELKSYREGGKLFRHCFYIKGRNVKKEVELVVEDVFDITDEEKVILKLKLGLEL